MVEIETLAPGDLLFLPSKPEEDLDKLIEEHIATFFSEPISLIAPYDLKSENKTAIQAASIKWWYPHKTVGIVMPLVIPSRLCQLVTTFRIGGFSPIVFLKEHDIIRHIPRLKNQLNDQQWYHVCDSDFQIPFEGVRGRWTRDGTI